LVASLSDYGLPLGEAFQLRDDVLGVYGDPAATGKPAGDDLREGKRTALVALAWSAANEAQRGELRRRLGDPHLDDDGVTVLRDVIAATGAVARVEELINERVTAALAALDTVDVAPAARDALVGLARTASERVG
jgi:geranylgeranyl diphosphate synthase type I